MRIALVAVLLACGSAPAPVSNREPPRPPAAQVLANGSLVPMNVAIVGSPAAVRSCVATPETCYQHDGQGRRLLVDPDVVLLRWRDVAIYATRAEADRAQSVLAGDTPAKFAKLAFAGMVGDLGMQRTTRDDLALIGRDAGVTLAGPDGFFIECFNCAAPPVITALAALGVQVR